MAFGASKSSRLVRKKDVRRSPQRRNNNRDRPSSPDELTKQKEIKRRTKALGINYLRSNNRRSPEKISPNIQNKLRKRGNMAHHVMESIKTVAQKSSRNGGMNLKVIFNRIDLDKNGTVDRNEFYQALNIVGVSLSKEESDLVFDTYDPNHTGGIDYEEFLYSFFNRRKLGDNNSSNSSSTAMRNDNERLMMDSNNNNIPDDLNLSQEILRPSPPNNKRRNQISEVNDNDDGINNTPTERRWSAWNKVKEHFLNGEKGITMNNNLDNNITNILNQTNNNEMMMEDNKSLESSTYTGSSTSNSMISRNWKAVQKHVKRHSIKNVSDKEKANIISNGIKTNNLNGVHSPYVSPSSKAANVPLKSPMSPLVKDMQHIVQLKEQGILTDLEFKHAKAKLLGLPIIITDSVKKKEEQKKAPPAPPPPPPVVEMNTKEDEEEKNLLQEKLVTTQKQLRRAFIENAEMSRTLRQMKIQSSPTSKSTTNRNNIMKTDDPHHELSKSLTLSMQENHPHYREALLHPSPSLTGDNNIDDEEEEEEEEEDEEEEENNESIGPRVNSSLSIPAAPLTALTTSKATTSLQLKNTTEKVEITGEVKFAVGFADIAHNNKKCLSLIRLTSTCIVIDGIYNFGRQDKFPKLIRGGNIGILDLVENTVQIVLRPTNELVEIVLENKGKAAAFAHEIHGLIQRSERKV